MALPLRCRDLRLKEGAPQTDRSSQASINHEILWPPPERRMLVIEIGLSLLVQTRQPGIHVPALPLLIARFHEEQHRHTQNKNARTRRQVQTVSNWVIGPVEWKEGPGPLTRLSASPSNIAFSGTITYEIRPPMLPNMTFVPMAVARAVSVRTFAETWALHRAPKEKAPAVMRNVAP